MKSIVSKVLYYTGIYRLFFALRKRHGITILMGHRVENGELGHFGALPPGEFEKFIAKASKLCSFISMSEACEILNSATPALPRNLVVLTFDDGFRDNYINAFPVLKKYKIPAIIYLTYNSIAFQQLPWPQRLGWLFEKTKKKSFRISLPIEIEHELATVESAKKVRGLIEKELYSTDFLTREGILMDLAGILEVDFPDDKMLSHEMIKEMNASNIFEFGAHTLSHPWCAKIPAEEARHEIVSSKLKLEELLGWQILHFAFPGGSLNDELIEQVKRAGFKSCFDNRMKRDGNFINYNNAEPFRLRRLGISNDCFEDTLVEMSGFYRFLRIARNKLFK